MLANGSSRRTLSSPPQKRSSMSYEFNDFSPHFEAPWGETHYMNDFWQQVLDQRKQQTSLENSSSDSMDQLPAYYRVAGDMCLTRDFQMSVDSSFMTASYSRVTIPKFHLRQGWYSKRAGQIFRLVQKSPLALEAPRNYLNGIGRKGFCEFQCRIQPEHTYFCRCERTNFYATENRGSILTGSPVEATSSIVEVAPRISRISKAAGTHAWSMSSLGLLKLMNASEAFGMIFTMPELFTEPFAISLPFSIYAISSATPDKHTPLDTAFNDACRIRSRLRVALCEPFEVTQSTTDFICEAELVIECINTPLPHRQPCVELTSVVEAPPGHLGFALQKSTDVISCMSVAIIPPTTRYRSVTSDPVPQFISEYAAAESHINITNRLISPTFNYLRLNVMPATVSVPIMDQFSLLVHLSFNCHLMGIWETRDLVLQAHTHCVPEPTLSDIIYRQCYVPKGLKLTESTLVLDPLDNCSTNMICSIANVISNRKEWSSPLSYAGYSEMCMTESDLLDRSRGDFEMTPLTASHLPLSPSSVTDPVLYKAVSHEPFSQDLSRMCSEADDIHDSILLWSDWIKQCAATTVAGIAVKLRYFGMDHHDVAPLAGVSLALVICGVLCYRKLRAFQF